MKPDDFGDSTPQLGDGQHHGPEDDPKHDQTGEVAELFESPNYLVQLRDQGPYACRICKALIYLPGICDGCAEAERTAKAHARTRKALATIPERWRWASFTDQRALIERCDEESIVGAKHALLRLISRKDWLLVLAGSSGKGKTSLACAMLRYVIERGSGRTALFVYAPRIARAYRNTRLGETPEIIDACERTWMLCIDDLGADAVYRDALREVIQVREHRQMPTVITTFLSEEEATEAYGGGVSRRMYRDGSIVWVGTPPPNPPSDGDGADHGSDLIGPLPSAPGPAKAVSAPRSGQGSSQVILMPSRANSGGRSDG